MRFPFSVFKLQTSGLGHRGIENHTGKPLDFYDSVKPVLIISRVFGLLPFTLHRNTQGFIQKSKIYVFDVFWLILTIIVNLTLAIVYLPSIYETIDNTIDKSILFASGKIVFLFSLLKVVVEVLLDLLNRNRFVKIVKDFVKFDESVRKN